MKKQLFVTEGKQLICLGSESLCGFDSAVAQYNEILV